MLSRRFSVIARNITVTDLMTITKKLSLFSDKHKAFTDSGM